MTGFSQIQRPPIKGELAFQEFCLKLIRRYWNDDKAELYARRGQSQYGIDIRGQDKRNNHLNAALQCKGSETNGPRELTEAEVEDEVSKARELTPKLNSLIIAYAGPRSGPLQDKAKALHDENIAAGLFEVALWSWDDIVDRAENFPDIAQLLLPTLNIVGATELSPRRPTGGSISAAAARVQTAMAEYQIAISAGPSEDLQDPIAQAKIDVWRDQVNSGEGKTVIRPMREFIGHLASDAAPRTRFRAYGTLGAALIQAGDFEGAAIAFDEAAAAEPEIGDGLAVKARASFTLYQVEKAYAEAQVALAKDKTHRIAAAILIDTAPESVLTTELEVAVSDTLQHLDVSVALSRRFAMAGQYEDALRAARQIEETKDNWTRPIAIGEAILSRFEENYGLRIGAPQSSDVTALLEEACQNLEMAWATVKDRSDVKNWVHVAANLGVIYRLQGRMDVAADFALGLAGSFPDSRIIKEQVALAHLHRSDFAKAMPVANDIAQDPHPDQQFLAAGIAASSQAWPQAEAWAQRAYDGFDGSGKKARAADIIVLAVYKQRGAEESLTKGDSLRPHFPASVPFEARMAEIARRSESRAHIDAATTRLAAFVPSKLNEVETFELAEALMDDGEWSRAADLLAGLHTTDRPTEALRKRLFALYRADRRFDARQLFDSLHGDALRSKEILRLGAAIYDKSGMLPSAISTLEKAIARDESDLRSRLDWARLCAREGQERRVAKWVRKVSLDFAADPEDFMELAQLLDRHGERKKALRLGYETLRRHWNSSEAVHMRYMSLFLLRGSKRERFLHPTVGGEDVVVFLRNAQGNGNETRYLISNDDPLGAEILRPDHPFAQKLTGAGIGDQITNDAAIGQSQEWKIVGLTHKFVDLFHRAMADHPVLFPGSKALGSFTIEPGKEDGFEPVFEQVRNRANYANEVTKLYVEQFLPVDVVARLLGIDAIDASLGLRFQLDKPIDNCAGSHEEREHALANLSSERPILPDLMTLALWQDIGLLPILAKLNSANVFVIQSVRDALKQRLEDARESINHGAGSLQAHGDKIMMIEPSKADKTAEAERRAALDAWVSSHTVVVATEAPNVLSEERISDVLSPAAIDTIATAAAENRVLLSEDHRLRVLAKAMGGRNSSWTQPYLIRLLEEGKITHQQYVQLIANLYRQKVGFVSVGANDLHSAADSLSGLEFDAIIGALCAPRVDPPGIIDIAGEFISTLWREERYASVKIRLTSKLLSTLVIGRPDGVRLLRSVVVSVNNKIRNLPHPLSMLSRPWNDYLEAFLRGHFIRQAVLE